MFIYSFIHIVENAEFVIRIRCLLLELKVLQMFNLHNDLE